MVSPLYVTLKERPLAPWVSSVVCAQAVRAGTAVLHNGADVPTATLEKTVVLPVQSALLYTVNVTLPVGVVVALPETGDTSAWSRTLTVTPPGAQDRAGFEHTGGVLVSHVPPPASHGVATPMSMKLSVTSFAHKLPVTEQTAAVDWALGPQVPLAV